MEQENIFSLDYYDGRKTDLLFLSDYSSIQEAVRYCIDRDIVLEDVYITEVNQDGMIIGQCCLQEAWDHNYQHLDKI